MQHLSSCSTTLYAALYFVPSEQLATFNRMQSELLGRVRLMMQVSFELEVGEELLEELEAWRESVVHFADVESDYGLLEELDEAMEAFEPLVLDARCVVKLQALLPCRSCIPMSLADIAALDQMNPVLDSEAQDLVMSESAPRESLRWLALCQLLLRV